MTRIKRLWRARNPPRVTCAPNNFTEESDCRIGHSRVHGLTRAPGVVSDRPHASTSGRWQLQSDVMEASSGATTASSITTHETVEFHDAAVGQVAGLDIATNRQTLVDETPNIDFVKFLSRPVRIANFTWVESEGPGTTRTYNPWQLYFSDARVRYKLNNFAFLQCKLKIKVLVNASPFYFGRMYMGYQPLPTLTPTTISADAGNRHFIPYSQRPHIWIDLEDNAGGEMTLPYFYQQNWINAQSNQAMIDQGQLSFINYTSLASANGVVGAGVTVSIYAWAEDVHLSGPSVGLATQSRSDVMDVQSDEYGDGVVSGPASAVARAASMLEKVPVIGVFATATRIGAAAVAGIASLFGWTNVPVIEDARPVHQEPFPQLASTQIAFPVQKLTLDPKNELSVDPRVVGLTAEDELQIAHLCQKESYLTTATWNNADLVDDIIFSSRVTPRMFDTTGGTNPKVFMTPMCWVSSLFAHWRGDIIFKFKVVASKYHKGRLRVSFDPSGSSASNILNDVNTSNVVFTSIIDLGESNEVEFAVPYQQAIAYLTNRENDFTSATVPFSTSSTPTFGYDPLYDNGTICVRVLTRLTSPLLSSTVRVMVSVRAGSNIEFANPCELPPRMTPWTPQSDVMNSGHDVLGNKEATESRHASLVNFGESIKSLRQLLRRSTLVSVSSLPVTSGDTVLWRKIYTKIPGVFGFDQYGINTAKGLVSTATTFNFNYSNAIPLTWLMPAFVAYRGSTHWTFNVATSSAIPAEHIRVLRLNGTTIDQASESSSTFAMLNATPSTTASNYYTRMVGYTGSTGSALVNARTTAGLSVGAPMYTSYRFQSTAPKYYTKPTTTDGAVRDMFALEVQFCPAAGMVPGRSSVWAYNAIGTDFALHFFLNVPVMWIYDTIPIAV